MAESAGIKLVKVADLIPYATNARTHSEEQVAQIAASIREFGFVSPVICDGNNGIIAGHGRVLGAQKAGLKEVPVFDASWLTPAQIKAYVLVDNKLALNAGWDSEMLRLELEALKDLEFDLRLTGFGADELKDIFVQQNPGLTDPDDVPPVPESSVSKSGDVWVMGRHVLVCGDSTTSEAVKLVMGDDLADQLITDPPYNVDYTGKTKEALTIENDAMGDTEFRDFLTKSFAAADTVMKPGAVFYIWHAESEGYNFRGACRDCGWIVRQCLIWNKSSMVMGRQDYHWKHEPCLYGWKTGATHLWATDRKQTTVLEFEKPQRNDVHPTMKPVELIQYQVLNNTKGEDIVLDLFGGSGSTLIACEVTGRRARVIELDPKYVDVIIQRWQAFTGGVAVLRSSGRTFGEEGAVGIAA